MLIAGLALGGYLWWDDGGDLGGIFGDEGKAVEPGSFTEFDDGFMVGSEQDATTGSIGVTVDTVDPTGEPELDYYEGAIEKVDRAWEIHTDQTPEEIDWLSAGPGSTFVAALPVPEDFDPEHLTALRFEYGEHMHHVLPSQEEPQDAWSYKNGYYHPGEGVFLVTLGSIGSKEQPTRLMVVEHAFMETQTVDGPLESPWSGSDDSKPSNARTEVSFASFSPLEPAVTSFDPIGQGVDNDPTGADGFQPICHASPCDLDRTIRGYTLESRVTTLEQALRDAVEAYEGMAGQQGPHLETDTYDLDGDSSQAYEFNLHGPHDPTISDLGSLTNDYSHPGCAGDLPNGWYNPSAPSVNLCLNTVSVLTPDRTRVNSLAASRSFAAHELHHAYQAAYTGESGDSAVFEGTARWVQNPETPTALSGWEFPPSMETTGTAPENEYKMEYLFFHLFSHEELDFSQLGRLYQQGMGFEALDTFAESRTSHDGLADAYWAFSKDLLYEDRSPSVRAPGPGQTPGTCELYEMDIEDVPESAGMLDPHVPAPIDVDERTVKVDTSTLEVYAGGNTDTIDASLHALASDVYEFDVDPVGEDRGLWLRATLEPPGGGEAAGGEEPEMRMKLYDAENEGTEECRGDDNEAELGGSAGIEVWEGDEEATLLVSNLEHGSSVGYRLVFEAFPMWAQTGVNGQRTYYIETPQGARELTTMSGPTAEFQDDEEEPGSLLWSKSSNGGTSRPSYAFGKVYTVFGQGGFQGLIGSSPGSSGSPSSSLNLPEGRIVAYDADTGDVAWKANDDSASLDIGSSAQGSGAPGTGGQQHEVIAGNGQVYVPGTRSDEYYPPQDSPCGDQQFDQAFQGVLAFNADDGSLAWEATPNGPPHGLDRIHQIALDHDTLYAKGAHPEWVKKSKADGSPSSAPDSCEEDRPYYWDTEASHKIWSISADGGEFQEVWSAPYERSEMVVTDGQAIIAGWAKDEEVPAQIDAVDLDTGETVWSHEDVFSPPTPVEDEDREAATVEITQLASDEGTVFVGTTVETPDGLQGAVYAFDESGRQWRYETAETFPTPAVDGGTLYAMTGDFNVSDEEDPGSPSDAVNPASVLHAVDVAANETHWAVNASVTMTVTDERIYVGKQAPLTDPMGASVAALDRATGEVVWTNEEDIQGPMALTGAFMDGVLYVNTQQQIVALNG